MNNSHKIITDQTIKKIEIRTTLLENPILDFQESINCLAKDAKEMGISINYLAEAENLSEKILVLLVKFRRKLKYIEV